MAFELKQWRLALLLCFGISSATLAPQQVLAYAFTAHGTWTSSDGELSGTWTADYDIAGGQIGGFMNLSDLPGASEGHIAGSVTGDTVTFDLSKGDEHPASFQGTLLGGTFDGNFRTSAGASGHWHGIGSPTIGHNTATPIAP